MNLWRWLQKIVTYKGKFGPQVLFQCVPRFPAVSNVFILISVKQILCLPFSDSSTPFWTKHLQCKSKMLWSWSKSSRLSSSERYDSKMYPTSKVSTSEHEAREPPLPEHFCFLIRMSFISSIFLSRVSSFVSSSMCFLSLCFTACLDNFLYFSVSSWAETSHFGWHNEVPNAFYLSSCPCWD